MTQRVVGFVANAARCGKSTAARLLMELLGEAGYGVVVLPLADPLKLALQHLVPTFNRRDEASKLREHAPGKTGRMMLEELGDLVRGWNDDAMLRALEARRLDLRGADVLIIPDVRRNNEAAWVRAQGGDLVRLLRAPAGPDGGHPHHPTKTSIITTKFVLDNTGDHASTRAALERLAHDMGLLP